MKILAFDTSTEACSAALLIDAEVRERYEVAPREHGALILPMIEALLNEAAITPAQLDAVAFGCGPGAFVGVRIAAGVAQGIAFAADLPVVPVSSLAALAQGVECPNVYSAIDARMEEVYWGAYRRNGQGIVELLGREVVCPPQAVGLHLEDAAADTGPWYGVGSGWGPYGDILRQQTGVSGWEENRYPQAQYVARIAAWEVSQGRVRQAAQAMPTYLRNDVAKKSKRQ